MKPEHSPSDGWLMARVRGGDEAAFEQLYHRHGQAVYAYLWRLLGDEDLAADLRQEAFLRLWRVRERWSGGDGVRGYLIAVARNLVIDSRRRHAVRERTRPVITEELQQAPPSPDQVLARRELAARLDEALDNLPPQDGGSLRAQA